MTWLRPLRLCGMGAVVVRYTHWATTALLSLTRGRARWSSTARVQRGEPATARCTSTGGHLVCASESWFLFRGVAEAALYCAHRTSTFLSCAFCEQEGHLAASFPFLVRIRFSLPGRPGRSSIGATFSPAHPLADIFHLPYHPIASQSISRDVPLARARAF